MKKQIKNLTKKCCHCKKTLSISRFYKNRSFIDGHDHNCITCNNERMKKYYHTEKGRAAFLKYRNTAKGKETLRRATLRFREKMKKLRKRLGNFLGSDQSFMLLELVD